MHKKALSLLLFFALILTSCGSSKNRRVVTTKKTKTTRTVKKPRTKPTRKLNTKPAAASATAKAVINNAKYYKGTRYKYGGTTKAGMDCSGLIYTAFKKENITIPRVSSAMAAHGDWIDLKTVKPGDLLFFATKKNSRKVNHVGLVTSTRTGNVEFIHSSTSKGVIVSNLAERYWYFAFVQARRLLK